LGDRSLLGLRSHVKLDWGQRIHFWNDRGGEVSYVPTEWASILCLNHK
jgi:hypothetical protein